MTKFLRGRPQPTSSRTLPVSRLRVSQGGLFFKDNILAWPATFPLLPPTFKSSDNTDLNGHDSITCTMYFSVSYFEENWKKQTKN